MTYRIAAIATLLIAGCATTTNGSGAAADDVSAGSIAVSSARPGSVAALISMGDAGQRRYGWWSIWHENKKAGKTVALPHTFTDIAPGKYVLVVYDPASADAAQESDGVVFESLTVTAETRRVIALESADYKDWNCLSCPWLYAMVDGQWQKLEEVLKDVVGRAEQTTTRTAIPAAAARDGQVTLRIAEEKREVTHLDRVVLRVGDFLIAPRGQLNLTAADERVHQLSMGQTATLHFDLPEGADTSRMELLVTGFYEPDAAFLQDVLDRFGR
ncbi:MAG: hypothetical protein ACI9OJ_006037 [Myxococcota bacterium]|jgi:hypothetical protein